jgi:hypothetical protein
MRMQSSADFRGVRADSQFEPLAERMRESRFHERAWPTRQPCGRVGWCGGETGGVAVTVGACMELARAASRCWTRTIR